MLKFFILKIVVMLYVEHMHPKLKGICGGGQSIWKGIQGEK